MTLGQNQYGKAQNHVVRIVRDGITHHIKDLTVSVALSGDMADVHLRGCNAKVLTTDATKNTVFAFAKEHGVESAERFGMHLARHFVASQEAVTSARVRIEEHAWERIEAPGGKPHSFVRAGRETRTAQITHDGEGWQILSGLKDLVVLNSTDSEFRGYVRDRYTTLPETTDRILATEVNARWRHAGTGGEPGGEAVRWDHSYATVRDHLLHAFAETYSRSLQETLYAMGSRVIDRCPGIDEIRLSLPNKHHFLVDLTPFGLENDNEVYHAADRPYGLIEATVLRDGAEAAIPVDLTNL
ncbi:urate oxidase [Streptomyces cinnamoneus]|uniref:Uricase n=1 Tax=Streptomyces cinnamoneus TaxID=53446 RepID=A0A2G1XA44_STRCJ|nr:urate oxidase [Streptomyces cinnamoneus]PHQ48085.1 urate oxidase [Streptomyces cinnamoneus]PPT15711.1 urate oxidase [Streptomyces cinnamoneus]